MRLILKSQIQKNPQTLGGLKILCQPISKLLFSIRDLKITFKDLNMVAGAGFEPTTFGL